MAGVLAVEELSGIFRHHKLEEFGALRNERVHQKENNPGVCPPWSRWRRRDLRCGPCQPYSGCDYALREASAGRVLAGLLPMGALILTKEGESVAAGLGEIDGADKRDRYQNS